MAQQMNLFRQNARTTLAGAKISCVEPMEGRFFTVGYAFLTKSDMVEFSRRVAPILDEAGGVCVYIPVAEESCES